MDALQGKKDNDFSVTLKLFPSATRKVVDSFVTSYESVFNDISFPPDTFNHPVAGTETIRWNKYHALHFYQEDELGNFKATFRPSRHYNNRNLCAALNILSFYDSLYKALALKQYPEAGLYVFRLFVSGSPVEVYVDDLVPCVHEGATCTIIGLNSCSSSFYAAILEKAVAKAIGGYRYIQELSLGDCIEILTGCTCFEVNLLNRSSFSTAFDTLRALSEYGHKLVACAIPRTSFEEQTFEESGVCCGIPYAILKTDVCRKNGVHHAFLIQVAAPSRGKALRYAFEYEMYKTEEVNGNFVSWLTVEDFAATFERVFLLLWPFGDVVWDHKTTVEFQVKSKYLSASSQFANNPSFLIQNKGRNSSPVMVSLSASSASDTPIGAQCFFYKAPNTENVDTTRLYNVCENNAFFQSGVLEGSEGSLFFNLLPRERLQMTLSSYVPSSVRIQISSVENVDASQLPETMASSTFSAQWNTLLKAKRFSDDIFQLSRITDGCIATLVLALSQTPSRSPPFPIGVLGWKGTSVDVVNVAKPHFCTQQERRTACVHSFVLTLAAGESLFLLPYCRGSRCPDDYALTVFCNETFAQSRVKAASVLQCTKT
ncbi:calpain-like cysteine peptidase, putative [Leishmania tarentolae]|uniref:Calpain-like cysteine peptidase, putative n=1 Tax=Leishmania tarentolae TaxID=5689 RepID=A0A640KEV3_LEITA|nr:calpain-like cysteine peptidase, putative [Leishmania tarentolae]